MNRQLEWVRSVIPEEGLSYMQFKEKLNFELETASKYWEKALAKQDGLYTEEIKTRLFHKITIIKKENK